MFVQVITGRVADAGALEDQFDDWHRRLAPDAAGFLGWTGGITPGGDLIVAVRFASAEQAQANSNRPEQGEWWQATERLLDGPAAFRETDDVRLLGGGGSDDAGFVQMMAATVVDRGRFQEVEDSLGEAFAAHRPDFLGGHRAWFADDELLAVDYFTSEAEAREGERRDMPEELAAGFAEWQSLVSGTRWYDLPHPWLASPPA